MINNNKHIVFIDYIRVIAMLMIVALHCICYYTGKWGGQDRPRIEFYDGLSDILHGIALPMFTCISGFLYAVQRERGKYSDYGRFVIGKVKRLLVPMIVWSAICMLIIPVAQFSFAGLMGYHHLWFLGMLFWLFVLSPILFRLAHVSDNGVLLCSCVLIVVSFLFSKNPMAQLPLEISDAGKYVCAFYAGIASGVHYKKLAKTENKRLWFVGVVLMLAFIAESMLWRRIDSLLIVNICHLSRYIMSTVLCVVLIAALMKAEIKVGKWIAYLSILSMGIYVIHHIVIELLLKIGFVGMFMKEHIVMAPVCLMFVVLVVSIMTADMIKRSRFISKLL